MNELPDNRSNLKRTHASTLMGIIGIATGLTVLLGLPIQKIDSAVPSIKVPGAYPYDEAVRIPTPAPSAEASLVPSPAPSLYRESSSAPVRDSRIASARRSLPPKAVRKAAFEYNGVANFCGFLTALPADVGVLDPKLGRTRELVKGGRVMPKNVTWLRKHRHAPGT
jgi:hypothetical protein